MAKYTELLGEYLENGNELPAIFSTITDFDDFFTARYIDREIGFETEQLFSVKLEGKANYVIPLYSQRITALNAAITALQTPSFKITKDNTGYYTTNTDIEDSGTESVTQDYEEGGTESLVKDYDEGGTETLQHGAQNGSRTQLPFNASTSQANEKTTTQQYTDTTTFGKTVDDTDTTTFGKTIDNTDTTTFGKIVDHDVRHDDYLKEEITHTGFTTTENLARIATLQADMVNLIDQCLKEFEHLFMQVYT